MFSSSTVLDASNGVGATYRAAAEGFAMGGGMMAGGLGGGISTGGTGLNQSMIGIMQGVLSGSSSGTTIAPGVSLGMQNMLDIMDDFITPGTATGSNVFQGMASAMTRVLTGSSTTPGSFQTMLDAMDTFLSSATTGSSSASASFQTMLGAMQTFVSSPTSVSSSASAPFQNMLGAMQGFLTNATSGSTGASSSFQAMLDIMQTDLFDAKVLSGSASTKTIKVMTNGDVQVSGADGTNTLTNMPRLHFSDESIATDINGNAGTTAKIIGLVFGADAVSNKTMAGIGLNLLDGGMSYEDLMQAALSAKLGHNFTTSDEINLIYHNLIGTSPSAGDLQHWEQTVTSGQYTNASLAVMAAETSMNTNNIHLVGLAQTGLEYLPVSA